MSLSFFSKLTSISRIATNHLICSNTTINTNQIRRFNALANTFSPIMNNMNHNQQQHCGCRCPCHSSGPCLQRLSSSSTSSSGSSSDGGEKGPKAKDERVVSLNLKEPRKEVIVSSGSSSGGEALPPPACASLNRPVDEHEVGLNVTRKSRSKPDKDKTNPEKQKNKRDKKSETPRQSSSASTSKSRSSSRKRAKDRLEALSSQDRDRRVIFAYKLLLLVDDDPEILDNILWTDECNFNLPKLTTLINKPPIAESEMLPQIAWCGMSTKGTVGPFFFNSHVTEKTYVKMLEDYMLPELQKKGYNLKELWFQQDGAPWHRSERVLDFLKSVFDYRIISLGTKFIWPPRSQDLTPMDYFFWDYMKVKLDFKHSKYDLCFQQSFREILTREVNTASVSALQGAIYQLPERLEMCLNENGDRFVHLLYPDRFEKDGTRKTRTPAFTDKQILKKQKSETISQVVANQVNTSTILTKELPKIDLTTNEPRASVEPVPANSENVNSDSNNNDNNRTQP